MGTPHPTAWTGHTLPAPPLTQQDVCTLLWVQAPDEREHGDVRVHRQGQAFLWAFAGGQAREQAE